MKHLVLDSRIEGLLDRLYAQSVSQNEGLTAYFAARAEEGSLDWNAFDARTNQFLSDKHFADISVSTGAPR